MTRQSATTQATADRDHFKSASAARKGAGAKPAASPPVQMGEHGRYLVKSGKLAGTFVARAFPKPPTLARGLIAEASGETEQAAIEALHALIDARESRRTESRRHDPRTGIAVPSTEEYAEALGQIALTRPQRAMLVALSLAGDEGLGDARISHAAGYKSDASAARALATAGRAIAEFLGVKTGSTPPDGTACLGARNDAPQDDKTAPLTLHPELRDAIRDTL
ncbi:hypothetical protein E2L08_15945 [Palleronia sediminis]|uniref:Uncharacterized protein n=1 Tax=Palleronia sediminis TaxID=2547833 RepID=A0A4R6A1G8_9RHOB|nr:hypothetical protein [Palleronia sediminis]TDL74836.1 hypothetical protein E2L08_15945 [Palleronia sediminis]